MGVRVPNVIHWVAILVLLLTGCIEEKSDEGVDLDLSRLFLDIGDARGLVVTDSDGAAATKLSGVTEAVDLDASSLYRVTLDGRLEKVTAMDAKGEEIPAGTIQPCVVAPLSDRFLYMAFWQYREEDVWGCDGGTSKYLVDIHTGRAFLEEEDGTISALRQLGRST